MLKEDVWAATFTYPNSKAAQAALAHTARLAWWSTKSAIKIIDEMAETPFQDKELRQLTSGRLTSIRIADGMLGEKSKLSWVGKPYNIGRNDLCVCGSGKKYKVCCLRKA
jgi:uncharacterized protein YecA (UPF0149 family)